MSEVAEKRRGSRDELKRIFRPQARGSPGSFYYNASDCTIRRVLATIPERLFCIQKCRLRREDPVLLGVIVPRQWPDRLLGKVDKVMGFTNQCIISISGGKRPKKITWVHNKELKYWWNKDKSWWTSWPNITVNYIEAMTLNKCWNSANKLIR